MNLINESKKGHVNKVRLLLKRGVDPSYQDIDGITALMYAKGYDKVVKLLLATGKSHPEFQDNNGMTALMHASIGGYVEVVKLLLASGKSHPEFKDNNSMTALMNASIKGYSEIVKLLLAEKSHPGYHDNDGRTALMFASIYGYSKIVDQLLNSRESHPEYKDFNGMTALMSTIQVEEFEYKEIVDLLLKSGEAHPEYQTADGVNALYLASNRGHTNIVKLLLDYDKQMGMNLSHPEHKDTNDQTPLMQACLWGYLEIVKLLLATGLAHPEWVDNSGWTALILAGQDGTAEVIKLLLLTGEAHPEYQNEDEGMTALMYASKLDHLDAMKVLVTLADNLCLNCQATYSFDIGKTAYQLASPEGKKIIEYREKYISGLPVVQKNIGKQLYRPGRAMSHKLYEESYPKYDYGEMEKYGVWKYMKQKVTNMSKSNIIDFILKYGGSHDIQSLCYTDFEVATKKKLLDRCSIQELIKQGKFIVTRMSYSELTDI